MSHTIRLFSSSCFSVCKKHDKKFSVVMHVLSGRIYLLHNVLNHRNAACLKIFFFATSDAKLYEKARVATNVFRFSLVKKAPFHFPPLCHHLIIIISSLCYLYIEEGKGVKWEWKDIKGNHSIIPLPRTFHFWKSLDSQKDSIDSLYLSFSRAISLYWHLFFFIYPQQLLTFAGW